MKIKKSVFVPFARSSPTLPERTIHTFYTINERNESCFLESRVSSAKYLGVILDDSLKWKP